MLKFDYEQRHTKNPKYSKRSYAKLLDISSGRLVEIFNGKAPVTEKKARAIVNKLNLTAEERLHFLTLVESEANTRLKRPLKPKKSHRLNHDEFALISDWEHFALMSLIETSIFKSDKKWIANKLGITLERLNVVIHTLENENLIKIDEHGEICNTYQSMTTMTDVPSKILKDANATCIRQGIEKMYEVSPDLRDITSMTFPVDISQIQNAKALIRKFKKKMADLMTDKKTTEIYNLNIQLIPVSKIEE